MGSCASAPKTNKTQNVIIPYKKDPPNNNNNPNTTQANQSPNQNLQQNTVETNVDNNKVNSKAESTTINHDKNKKAFQSTIQFSFNADIEELLLPIYLRKDDTITITVQGQWSFFPEGDPCSFTGHPNTLYNDDNIGQLLCRVQGGKTYAISNKKVIFKSDSNGQLLLYANTDKTSVTPSGSLDITIEDTAQLSQEQIDLESGWSTIYKPSPIESFLQPEEYELINLINKIRVNPPKFAQQYLDIFNEPDASHHKQTYELLSKYTPIPPLGLSKALYSAAKDHCEDIGSTGMTGHISSMNNNTIKQRIMKYSDNTKHSSLLYFGENCSYGKKMPLSIALDMIIDFGLRNKYNQMNILNEKFNAIGVSISKHYSFKWVCVIVFALEG